MKVYYNKDGIKREIPERLKNLILKNEKGEEMFLEISLRSNPDGTYEPDMISAE